MYSLYRTITYPVTGCDGLIRNWSMICQAEHHIYLNKFPFSTDDLTCTDIGNDSVVRQVTIRWESK